MHRADHGTWVIHRQRSRVATASSSGAGWSHAPRAAGGLPRTRGSPARCAVPNPGAAVGDEPREGELRVRGGHWQRLHQGVYATFTGQPDREAILWAALRRAGPDAVLSHWTAAELSKLTSSQSWLIHVTVPRHQHVRPISGVMIHRSSRVNQARHPAVMPPRTRIEETALDLAGCSKDLEDALAWLARACATRLTTPDRIRAALGQRARVRWRRRWPRDWTTSKTGHTLRSNSGTSAGSSAPMVCPGLSGRSGRSMAGAPNIRTRSIRSSGSGWKQTARSPTRRRRSGGTGTGTTRPPPTGSSPCVIAGPM